MTLNNSGIIKILTGTMLPLLVSACGSLSERSGFFTPGDGAPQHHNIDIASIPDARPRVEPPSRYGNPESYVVGANRYYTLKTSAGYRERGTASWYGTKFHGRRTSSGEAYDMFAMTAAHKTLPLPTYLEVTNLNNNRKVIVRVNDRGPFLHDRLLDLSYAAAAKLGVLATGTAPIEIRAIDPVVYQQRMAGPAADLPAALPPPDPVAKTGSAETAAITVKAAPPVNTDIIPDQGIYLQVAAFSDRRNAERLRQRLSGITATRVQIQAALHDNMNLYRVNLGPISTPAEADQIANQIAALGLGQPRRYMD